MLFESIIFTIFFSNILIHGAAASTVMIVSPDSSVAGALVLSSPPKSEAGSILTFSKYNKTDAAQIFVSFKTSSGETVFSSKANSKLCVTIPKSVNLTSPPTSSAWRSLPLFLDKCRSSNSFQQFSFQTGNGPSFITVSGNSCLELGPAKVNSSSVIVLQNTCPTFIQETMYVIEADSSQCSSEVCGTVHAALGK